MLFQVVVVVVIIVIIVIVHSQICRLATKCEVGIVGVAGLVSRVSFGFFCLSLPAPQSLIGCSSTARIGGNCWFAVAELVNLIHS